MEFDWAEATRISYCKGNLASHPKNFELQRKISYFLSGGYTLKYMAEGETAHLICKTHKNSHNSGK
jgi:hypothetical protein